MTPLGLFEGYGIEIEYMVVGEDDLDVLPIADRVLVSASGRFDGEVERGPISRSNELVLHVVELKTNGPRPSLDGLADDFASDVRHLDGMLREQGARLLPTAMHPWMNPLTESRLWPHEYNDVYRAFDRIFGCKGHGFSNLQSMHVNLPFRDDREFARLHAAIRLVLPLLPALAASSPLVEGRLTSMLDNRLHFYRRNQWRMPIVTGLVIPEQVSSRAEYERRIFDFIAAALRPADPDGILEPEWVNSRGAIARFVRNSIEIRLIDSQECPSADVAIAMATIAVVRALVEEKWTPYAEQYDFHESLLDPLFRDATERAGAAVASDERYLRAFGLEKGPLSLRDVWAHLASALPIAEAGPRRALDVILRRGCLSERIVAALGGELQRERIRDVYRELSRCLVANESFSP